MPVLRATESELHEFLVTHYRDTHQVLHEGLEMVLRERRLQYGLEEGSTRYQEGQRVKLMQAMSVDPEGNVTPYVISSVGKPPFDAGDLSAVLQTQFGMSPISQPPNGYPFSETSSPRATVERPMPADARWTGDTTAEGKRIDEVPPDPADGTPPEELHGTGGPARTVPSKSRSAYPLPKRREIVRRNGADKAEGLLPRNYWGRDAQRLT